MKRIISFILSFLILVISVPCNFALANVEEMYSPTKSEIEAVRILKHFGAIDESFKADSIITRAEFTMLLINAMNENEPTTSEIPFTDITSDMESFNSIAAAYGLGLISKAELFNPDAPILTEHAYKMLVIALGYNIPAESKGGYSSGFNNVAFSLSLNRGADVSLGKELYGASAARLVMNMLESPVFVQTSYGANEHFEIEHGSVYMSKVLDIYKAEGIVTANNLTDLDGFSVSKDYVKIDGVKYYAGDSNVGLYLGQNVEFYYQKSIDDELAKALYAEPKQNRNKVIVVDATMMNTTATTAKKVVYLDENHKRREAILSDNVSVVYNGSELFGYNREHLLPAVGNVTLIDNNSNGAIDVVLVRNYRLAVVHMADAEADTIYLKFGEAKVELENLDGYILSKNDNICDLSELSEWDVVCIAESGNIVEILASSDSASGTISEIAMEDNEITEIKIEDKWYEISNGYIEKSAELDLGISGVFYLGVDGRVAAGNLATTEKPFYAVLMETEKVGRKKTEVQLFTQDGEAVYMNAAERVIVDGEKVKRDDLPTRLDGFKGELVTINANSSGELTEIDTPVDLTALDGHDGYDEDNFSLDRNFASVRFTGLFGGCWKSKETLFFSVPTDKTNLELYKCENAEAKLGEKDVTYKNIKVYDLDRFNTASVIVYYDYDKEMSTDVPGVDLWNHFFVITDIRTALDNEDNYRKKVCGYYLGTYQEFFVADGGARNVDTIWKPDNTVRMENPLPNRRTKWGFIGWTDADFKIGDIIQPEFDVKGDLKFFRMLYSAKLDGIDVSFGADGTYGGDDLIYYSPGDFYELNELGSTQHHKDDPGYVTMIYTAVGEVTDIDGSNIRFNTELAMEEDGNIVKYKVSRVQKNMRNFYIFNRNEKTVTKAAATDLRLGDKIFLHSRGYVVIIKE